MTKWTVRCVVLTGLLLASVSLHAHHSLAGVYALGKEAKVSGAFKAFRLVNPHSSMKLDVKNADGTTTNWVMTLGSATALAQRGVGKTGPNALHTGDTITVKCIPAKDGHPLGFLKSVTYADGHVVVVSGGGPND